MFTWLDGEGTLTSVEAKSRRCEVGSSESIIEITVSIEENLSDNFWPSNNHKLS